MGESCFQSAFCFFGESGEYSRSTCEVRKVILLFFLAQYSSVKLEGQNVRFETLLEALWSLLGGFGCVLGGSGEPFGDVLEPLGRSGGSWRGFGRLLDASWARLETSWEHLGGPLGGLVNFCLNFKRFWIHFCDFGECFGS